jgi:hypothetical protein
VEVCGPVFSDTLVKIGECRLGFHAGVQIVVYFDSSMNRAGKMCHAVKGLEN